MLCGIVVYLLVWKTSVGYQMRAVGLNPRASKCFGISVYRNIILSSVISGGLAGIAGAIEIAGLHHKLLEGLSPNYGYIAIIVSLLGNNHPAGVIVAALGIAALEVGSLAMQRSAGVPTSISFIIMGSIVVLILARKTIFRVSWLTKRKADLWMQDSYNHDVYLATAVNMATRWFLRA